MPNGSSQNSLYSPALLWCFRIVVALQCFGIAASYVLSANETESDVYGFLFFDCGWQEHVAQCIDDVGAYGCLLAGLVLVVNGFVQSSKPGLRTMRTTTTVDMLMLIFVASWAFVLAAARSVRGELFAELTIGEHAVRIVTPIAMTLYLRGFGTSTERLARIASGLLLLAVAVTFAVHGYKAQKLYGSFTDLILLTDQRIFHFDVEQVSAEKALWVIGWVDIVVAVMLLVLRWRVIAAYMMFWGLLTAASRMTAFGWVGWPDTFIRSANWGAPLLVLLLLHRVVLLNEDADAKTLLNEGVPS